MAANLLETLRRTVQEVNAAPNLQQALDIIVQRVQQNMQVDVASVYLTDFDEGQHVLMATVGLDPSAIGKVRLGLTDGLVGLVAQRAEPVNLEDGPLHPKYLATIETDESPYHGFLGVPIIQHRKVLGVLVVRQKARRKFAENEVTFLVTLAAQLAGAISHAQATGGVASLLEEVNGPSVTLEGYPGAPGVAVAEALVVYPPANLDAIPDRRAEDPAAEERRFREAIKSVQKDIRSFSHRMAAALPSEDLALFDVYVMLLGSDSLVEQTVARIRKGLWAPAALRETIAEHVRVFDAMEDPYLRERGADIRDLGRRILVRLQSAESQIRAVEGRTILVGEEVGAAHLAEIPTQYLAGVVSARGSSSSHVAILAHALGVPAVMGVEGLPAPRLDGQQLVIDGYRGRVYVRPTETVLAEFERLEREEAELASEMASLADQPAETPDGVHVPLYVNSGLLADIAPSLRSGADGVGLYRTEIPFLVRDGFPGEDEQARIYAQVLQSFAPGPVVLRTLDVGGDKVLPYFPIEEENPFLGWRGIRITLDHPEIFLTQLRAMLRAAEGLDNLRILLPMISGVREVDDALEFIHRARAELVEEGFDVAMPPVGAMIEVPSVLYQIDELAERVDFFSVGTNDLIQYLLAVDRNNARVADLYDTLHPAVVRALWDVVNGAHQSGREVSVCGEMAGDPAGAILLLGMGVDSLSMTAGSLPRVKWVLRSISHSTARDLLEQALETRDAAAVRQSLNRALEGVGLGGLVRAGR